MNHDPAVQDQAIRFIRNLVNGCVDSIEYVFTEEAFISQAIGRQLSIYSKSEVCIQVYNTSLPEPHFVIRDAAISELFV
ncbi:uncharacterized protein LOC104907002 isoform X2 [Beta vulgaris subsp. vulgaris]|uniref:uncharacterized protein LOC104907002 isoform X2 n=1 Tax=Beta vulgaris subsp. vulgaris TaxID=3555 RepID=UPI002036F532|nr:uncharacterized protein LOC104907002 isoform X2 [Beta vulgaris subsp. vulgaris]